MCLYSGYLVYDKIGFYRRFLSKEKKTFCLPNSELRRRCNGWLKWIWPETEIEKMSMWIVYIEVNVYVWDLQLGCCSDAE